MIALDSAISQDVSQEYDYSVLTPTYTPEQIDDFRGSAIDPALVLLNCRRLHRQDEMIYALRKIDGNRKTSGQGLLAEFVKRQPIQWTDGGVGFWGYADTLTAVQVKPDDPQLDRKGKPRKYESPAGLPPQLIIPRVTPQIWQRIAERVNVPMGIYTDYREWLIAHPQIWICITEGYKKVLALISAGYPAIGFTGISTWSPRRENDWDLRKPIPDLVSLLTSTRHFVNLFDCDSSAHTIATVNSEVGALAKVLIGQGCTVNRGTWDSSNKGIDDLIFNCGVKFVERVISDSKPITLVSIDASAKKPPENMVSEVIAKEYQDKLVFCSELKEWYWYEKSGKWIPRNSDEIDAFFRYEIEKQVPNYGTTNYVNNVINAAKSRLLKLKWNEASSRKYTPFKNGVLNLKTLKLEPYKPDFYFRWQLSYDYNILAECEAFKKWLLETTCGDTAQVSIIRAYYKAILTGRTDLERYLEIVGVGGGGKGTVTNIAVALIGRENCHFTDLPRMETDKFESANYANKRLIVISDSDHYAGGVNKLKELTGGDIMRSERKYKDATTTKPIGMVWINANEVIQSTDYTSGLQRRRLSLPFRNQVRREDRRVLLKFDGEGEMVGEFSHLISGIYNWVIGVSDEDVKNLILNTEQYVPSMATWANEVLLQTNPLAAWLDTQVIFAPGVRTQIGNATEIRISVSEEGLTTSRTEFEKADKWLYANYRQWYLSNGSGKPIASKRFRALLLDLTAAQLRAAVTDGKDEKGAYFMGLALRPLKDATSPSPVTGGGNFPPRLMAADGCLTEENGSADGFDGYDGSLESSPQITDDVVVANPPPHHSHTEFLGKNAKKGQNGYNPSAPSTPAISHPSAIHQHPSNPSAPSTPAVSHPSVGGRDVEDPNLMSIVDALAALAQLPTEEGLEGLADLYSVWFPDEMGKASAILKSKDNQAYVVVASLVASHKKLEIGDRVKNKHTGEEGILTLWAKDRKSATIQTDSGDLSDWILSSDLLLLQRCG